MKQNLSNDLRRNIFVNRADGDENPNAGAAVLASGSVANAAQVLGDIIGGNNRRRAGLRINGVFFSIESILLAALLVVSVIALKK